MLLRKEKQSVCSAKHYCTAFPAIAQVSTERKGRVPVENWGKCLTQQTDMLPYIRSGCEQQIGCSFSPLFRVWPRELILIKRVVINVPLEGRPPAKNGPFLQGGWMKF